MSIRFKRSIVAVAGFFCLGLASYLTYELLMDVSVSRVLWLIPAIFTPFSVYLFVAAFFFDEKRINKILRQIDSGVSGGF